MHNATTLVLAFYENGKPKPQIYRAKPVPVLPKDQNELRFFVNGFFEPVERIEAVIQFNTKTAPLEFKETFSKENRRRFWKGRLAAGAPSLLNLSVTIKISEYDSAKRRQTNYGVTFEVRPYVKPDAATVDEAPELLSLFGGDAA